MVFPSYQWPSLNTDMKTRGRMLHCSPVYAPKDHINPFSTAVLQEPTTHHNLHFFGPTPTTVSIFLISFHFCLYIRQNSRFLDVWHLWSQWSKSLGSLSFTLPVFPFFFFFSGLSVGNHMPVCQSILSLYPNPHQDENDTEFWKSSTRIPSM